MLLISLLGTMAHKLNGILGERIGASQVRHALMRSSGRQLSPNVTGTRKQNNFYEWAKTCSASMLDHLSAFDLEPTENEYTTVMPASALSLKKSPYQSLTQEFRVHRGGGRQAPLPPMRNLPEIVQDITAELSDAFLTSIDNELDSRRITIEVNRVRFEAMSTMKRNFRETFVKGWQERARRDKRDLQLTSMGSHFVDPTGAYRDAYFDASVEVLLDPPEHEVLRFINECMESPETTAALEEIVATAREAIRGGNVELAKGNLYHAGVRAANLNMTVLSARAALQAQIRLRDRELARNIEQAQQRIMQKRTREASPAPALPERTLGQRLADLRHREPLPTSATVAPRIENRVATLQVKHPASSSGTAERATKKVLLSPWLAD
ncbi:MAG TPA: hypothetical protein VL424_05780 [Pararobbsia sp.]|nr:hypothetical protein [Pararobbsia sp.]